MTEKGETVSAEPAQCLLCGEASIGLFQIAGYGIRQCRSCAHQFAEFLCRDGHVERTYGDAYFYGGADGYSNYLSEERLLVDRGRWYARQISGYCQPGTVLDVGAAAGFTLAGFSQGGWQCFGVEPNAGMAEYATERFGFPVAAAAFESWDPNRSFDLLTMLQVLPHFVDPGKALARAADLVRPGGHLVVETWNQASWTARILGRHWHEYSPPSVLHWFSKDGLIRLAKNAGFQPLTSGRPSKWIDAGHAKSLLRSKAGGSVTSRLMFGVAKAIPDQVAIPYPFDDLVWLLFRR